mgnify:CR=1 FL=1
MDTLVLVLVLIIVSFVVGTTALIFSLPGPQVPLAPNFECFVINMRKNMDRMAHFDWQYNRSELAARPYTRVEAVNGYELGDQIKDHVSPKVWLGLEYLRKSRKRLGEGQLTAGMIGCYMSHYSIYEQIVASGLPYAIIFEDDAQIHPRIYTKIVRSVVEEDGTYPPDWDVLLLGHWCKMCNPITRDYSQVKYFWGLHGYMVSQRGAQKLLENREQEISMQIDHYMSWLAQKGRLNVCSIHPSYVVPGNFGTDLQLQVVPSKM